MTNEEFQNLMLGQLTQLNGQIKGINDRLGKLENGQDKMVDRLGKLENGQDKMVDRLDKLEDGQEKIVGRLDKLEDGQEKIVGRLDKLEDGQDKIVDRLDKVETGQEVLQEGQNKHTILLENIDKKLDITAEVINSNFDNNQREHEEINNNIARKVWIELARMVK